MFGFFNNRELISDHIARTKPAGIAKPGYLQSIIDPVYGTKITRISGDPGTAITNVSGGIWGSCARHHYSLDQSWNVDQSLLYFETNVDPDGLVAGGSPNGHIFLDGNTYIPQFAQQSPGDVRWHVSDPTLMYYVSGNVFGTWNPRTNQKTTIKTFTGNTNLVFGQYKGFYSNDGDMFVFNEYQGSYGTTTTFAYRVSTNTKYPDITVTTYSSSQISPLGTYLISTNHNDDILIFDPITGSLLSTWTAPSAESGSPSHSDVSVDANGDECMVGIAKGPSPYDGQIVKRRLSDGTYTLLTPLTPKNYGQHCSARNTSLANWCFASQPYNGSSYPLYNESLTAMKMDGSKVLQLCHTHATNTQSDYYSSAQASPSPTGDRVIFSSNWDDPNGTGRPVQDYICDLRDMDGFHNS